LPTRLPRHAMTVKVVVRERQHRAERRHPKRQQRFMRSGSREARRGNWHDLRPGAVRTEPKLRAQARPVPRARRDQGGRQRDAARCTGRDAGAGRRVRLRQEHAGQDAAGAALAHVGQRAAARSGDRPTPAPRARAPDPADLPGPVFVAEPAPHRGRHCRRAAAHPRGGLARRAAARGARHARPRRHARAHPPAVPEPALGRTAWSATSRPRRSTSRCRRRS